MIGFVWFFFFEFFSLFYLDSKCCKRECIEREKLQLCFMIILLNLFQIIIKYFESIFPIINSQFSSFFSLKVKNCNKNKTKFREKNIFKSSRTIFFFSFAKLYKKISIFFFKKEKKISMNLLCIISQIDLLLFVRVLI